MLETVSANFVCLYYYMYILLCIHICILIHQIFTKYLLFDSIYFATESTVVKLSHLVGNRSLIQILFVVNKK